MANGNLEQRLSRMGQAIAAQQAEEAQTGDPGRQALEGILAQQGGQQQSQQRPLAPQQRSGEIPVAPERAAAQPQPQQSGRAAQSPELGDTLEKRLRRLQAVQIGRTSSGQAFQEQVARTFVDNVMQTPRVIGDILAGGAAAVQTLAGLGGNQQQGMGERFGQAFEQQQQTGLAGGLRNLPMPSGTDITGAIRSMGSQLPGGADLSLQEGIQTEEDRALQQRQEQPGATFLGEAVGDAATIATGRAPTVARTARRRAVRRGGQEPARRTAEDLPPGVRRRIQSLMDRDISKRLRTGTKKAGEAGMEGAVMAILNEGDPAETAALAAGTQVGSSMALEGSRHIIRNPAGVGGALVAGAALWQMMKEATPGGRDYILESFETSASKMAGTLALGALGGLAGGARASKKLQEDLPTFADAITSVPRNTMISMAEDFMSRETPPSEDVDAAFQAFVRDPNTFGPTARKRLQRAFTNPKVSIEDEFENLIENSESFRQRLDELNAPAD